MKVLLVTPYFYPKIGGVERHTYNIARGLTACGHTVHVVTTQSSPDYAAHEMIDGIIVTRMPINFVVSMTPIGFSWIGRLRRIIREFNPDIIEAHAPVPGLADLSYFLRHGKKYVIKYHSGDMRKGHSWIIDSLLQLYQKTILKYLFLHADSIMAVYPNYVESLIHSRRPIHFIPPGVDIKIFRPKKLKKRYDVLYVGRIEHASDWKGIDILLEAVAKIKKSQKDLSVALVGSGDAIEHFTAMSTRLGIHYNVHFLGSIQGEDLVNIYNQSRVLALPSLTEAESFGNVLIEAMACRIPVVGSRVGGIPNVISHESDGILCTPGSSAELSRAIKKILTDSAFAKKIGDNGYTKATTIFNKNQLIRDTDRVLRTIASEVRNDA